MMYGGVKDLPSGRTSLKRVRFFPATTSHTCPPISDFTIYHPIGTKHTAYDIEIETQDGPNMASDAEKR